MGKKNINITIDDDVYYMIHNLRENRELSPVINTFLRNFTAGEDLDVEELEALRTKKKELSEELNLVSSKVSTLESKKRKNYQRKLNDIRNKSESFRRAGGMARVLRENVK